LWNLCQRYNLKAIHNDMSRPEKITTVVESMSKIQSESNSQLALGIDQPFRGCGIYVKDTIWKQFTTIRHKVHGKPLLWNLCQRYNLKAIHNLRSCILELLQVVESMSKIQSESNSQQPLWGYILICGCGIYVKDTIWKQFTTNIRKLKIIGELWNLCQRYNLKAIHNVLFDTPRPPYVVESMSKIQSESNSQQARTVSVAPASCGIYVKDTIWKQFTTGSGDNPSRGRLWNLCQRYNLKAIHNQIVEKGSMQFVVESMSKIQSESNSQLRSWTIRSFICCGIYVKDTIWKQFTTPGTIPR